MKYTRALLTFVFFISFLFVSPIEVNAASPVGTFDAVSNSACQVSGWARDPDTTASISVQVYRDGPVGVGTSVGTFVANVLRSDLPFTSKNHGFIITLPVSSGVYDGVPRNIYIYGLDATGNPNALLALNPRSITCQSQQVLNDAQFISQTVPTAMTTGVVYPVSVTFKNTGSRAWTGNNPYHKLGSQNPDHNVTWGTSRVTLASNEQVLPGQQKTFNFSVTAPKTTGTYVFQWRMLEEFVEWFGSTTPAISVVVSAPPVSTPNVVSVTSFGALGNGASDDSIAIQRAIDALPSTGGTVTIPSGTFLLGTSHGSALHFEDGTSIQTALLISKSNVVIKGAGTSTVLMLAPNKKMRAISITGSNVTIDSLTVDGNKANRNEGLGWPTGDVVDTLVAGVFPGSNITVKNCEMRNGLEDGVGFWQSADARVENCDLHHNGTPKAGSSGISLSGGARGTALNNRIYDNDGPGIWSAFGSTNVVISNNTILRNTKQGIVIGGFTVFLGSSDNHSGFSITGNTIAGNGSAGFDALYIASSRNGTISNNTLTDNFRGAITIADDGVNPASASWLVTNNICSNTTATRTQKKGIQILGRSTDITVTQNICRDNGTSINDQMIVASTTSVNADWKTANTLTFAPTEAQIQQILNLLKTFGVSSAFINAVEAVLRSVL